MNLFITACSCMQCKSALTSGLFAYFRAFPEIFIGMTAQNFS